MSSSKKKAKRRLWDIQPTRVDVVDAPANLTPFLVCKSKDKEGPMGTEPNVTPVTPSLEEMIASLGKDITDLKSSLTTVDLEKKAPMKAIREVGEKALSLAKKIEEEGDKADMDQIGKEVAALIKTLQSIASNPDDKDSKYPEPDVKKSEQAPSAAALMAMSNALYDLSVRVQNGTSPNEAVTDLANSIAGVKDMLSKFDVAKSEKLPELPEVFSGEDVALQKAEFSNLLRQMVLKAGSVAAIMGETPTDAQKADLQSVLDLGEALVAGVPTKIEKDVMEFVNTLKGITSRADALLEEATKLGMKDETALSELKSAQEVVKGLEAKFTDVKKSACEVGDLATALSTSALLDKFEEGLRRLGIEKAAPVAEPQKQEPVSQTPDVASKLDALADQVKAMQTILAKSKGSVPPPAAPETGDTDTKSFPACPGDYNDPAYREKTKEWGL